MNKYCFLNGKILPLNKAKISPLDLGFCRGYALTETLRTYNGKIFALDKHYERLEKGAKFLKLRLISKDKVEKIIEKLIKLNRLKEAKIKIVLSGGVGKKDLEIGKETIFIYAEKLKKLPEDFYKNGVKLITSKYKREYFEYKIASYIEIIRNKDLLKKQKAFNILYTYDGYVYECATANIFCFKGKNLITPDKVLEGVTRYFVIKLAKNDFNVFIRPLRFKELIKADEVFITSTTIDILPVVKIDNYKINNGKVGEKTKFLMEKWKNFVNSQN